MWTSIDYVYSILGGAFFLIWALASVICYRKFGLHAKRNIDRHRVSKIYCEIVRSLPNRPHRFRDSPHKARFAQTLAILAFVYDGLQMSMLTICMPLLYYASAGNASAKAIYFLRIICLDLPIALMIPFLAALLVMLGVYLLIMSLHSFTRANNFMMRRVHNWLTLLISMDEFGPEIMDFFFSTSFLNFIRFSFRLWSCAFHPPVHPQFFLRDEFYGDFTCWTSGDLFSLDIFALIFLLLVFMMSLMWIHKRGIALQALPGMETYLGAMHLVKFFLCGLLVFSLTLPLLFLTVSSAVYLALAFYVWKKPPYLYCDGKGLILNSFTFGVHMAGFFTAIMGILTSVDSSPRYHHWVVFLFFVPIVLFIATKLYRTYCVNNSPEAYSRRSSAVVKELLMCIYYDDMSDDCMNYIVVHFCDTKYDDVLAHVVDSELNDTHRLAIFGRRNFSVPFACWWVKWKVAHPTPDQVNQLLLIKTKARNGRIPPLAHLCMRVVIQHSIAWENSDVIPADIAERIHELMTPTVADVWFLSKGPDGPGLFELEV